MTSWNTSPWHRATLTTPLTMITSVCNFARSPLLTRSLFLSVLSLVPVLAVAESSAGYGAKKTTNPDMEEVVVISKDSKTEPLAEVQELLSMPGTGGDPIRVLDLMPGVSFAAGEDESPVIRGSGPYDNYFEIDFVPAGYLFHIFGDSIFNENLIRSFDVYPSAFGPSYGDAIGGVIDVGLRNPRSGAIKSKVDISMLKSGVLFEGGTFADQAFFFSYRQSLVHLFLKEGDEEDGFRLTNQPIASDYQFKYTWSLSDDHTLSFMNYGARDELGADILEDANLARQAPGFEGRAFIQQGFHTEGVTWDWRGDGVQMKTALARLTEKNKLRYATRRFEIFQYQDLFLKQEWVINQSSGDLRLGGEVRRHDSQFRYNTRIISCSELSVDCTPHETEFTTGNPKLKLNLGHLFFEKWLHLTDQLVLSLGGQQAKDTYTDNSVFEPRVSLTWWQNEDISWYTRAGKYHQLPSIDEVLPGIGNPQLNYIRSDHYLLGRSQSFANDMTVQIELYYKDMYDMVLSLDDDDEGSELNYVNEASGEAYGVDLLVKKDNIFGLKGWFTMSLARSERRNDLTGETNKFSYDVPWKAALALTYDHPSGWIFGGKWTANAGSLYTPVVDFEANPSSADHFIPVYGAYNSDRLSPYHRLDLRAEKEWSTEKIGYSIFIDVINVYNHSNVSQIEKIAFTDDEGDFVVEEEKNEGIPFYPAVGFSMTL